MPGSTPRCARSCGEQRQRGARQRAPVVCAWAVQVAGELHQAPADSAGAFDYGLVGLLADGILGTVSAS
ncbi:hypothetical protein [Nocardia sp. R6R-6]|uniref:hypothetical protein n=1 Tax=Nocardia sp. R6R-6 TaxID=3459303 RepID=UPI00403E2C36